MKAEMHIVYTEIDGESKIFVNMDFPWAGTVVENQEEANRLAQRVGHLLLNSDFRDSAVSDEVLRRIVEGE